MKKFLSAHWLALLIGLAALLRLPSLFEPFIYGDEGIYLTLGQAIRKGLTIYKDIHDNKPPLLYLLAALAGNFFYFRLILFSWSLLTIAFFSELAEKLFGKNKKAILIAVASFALLSTIRLFEGTIANAENFMIGTTIAGFYLYLKSKTKFQHFLVGVLFSLSVLFKVPSFFDFAALFAFIFLVFQKKNWRLTLNNSFFILLGFVSPILVTTIYFAFQGALFQYLSAAFFQNLPYLSSWTTGKQQSSGLPLPLLGRSLAVLLVFLFLFWQRRKISRTVKLVTTWFVFSLFAALLSNRPYPHYLLQTVPPLTLATGLIFSKGKEKIIPPIFIAVFLISFLGFRFWHYPSLSYYRNFFCWVVGQQSQSDYFRYFSPQTEAIYQTVNYLKTRTANQEKIFIWGDQPAIYGLSNRLPVGRYTVAYHIKDFNGYQETMQALQKNPPRYLVTIQETSQSFPALEIFILRHYALTIEIGGFKIFHRNLKIFPYDKIEGK